MNKRDYESIGYLLSESESFQEFREMLFERFPKIKEEFDLFQECKGISDDIFEEHTRILEESYGAGWATSRKYSDDCKADPKLGKRLLEQARVNIQGEF